MEGNYYLASPPKPELVRPKSTFSSFRYSTMHTEMTFTRISVNWFYPHVRIEPFPIYFHIFYRPSNRIYHSVLLRVRTGTNLRSDRVTERG